jgi:hypothetical protein
MTADGRYRSAVNDMLLVKENAWAVPLLNELDFQEWIGKNKKVRQASRMVQKEQNNELDELKPGSVARQNLALALCRKAGLVVEHLEERNEMSETPLIREAGDGRARNVLLLLERVPTLTQSKRMSWPSLP